MKEELQFLRGLIVNPRGVGAVAPSSPWLGRAMAAQMESNRPGPILELGPGTGSITREILNSGLAPERLTVIEYDPAFAKMVSTQFPDINVINGDAFKIDETLGHRFSKPFATIFSCIPLLNHPPEKRRAFIEAAFSWLEPGAPLIQFSYGLHSPIAPPAGVTARMTAFVWRNLPPARVWVYRRR